MHALRLHGLPHLDGLEAESMLPVPEELLHLLWLVVVRLGQLLAPPRSMTEMHDMTVGVDVFVLDNVLVVQCFLEGPNVLFVKAVIDNDVVGIRRVRVQGLTLDIVVLPLFIIVLPHDDG